MAAQAWKTTLTMATLESGTYKAKLAEILDEARSMHLSEREAAQEFGHAVAALVTLQRKVRGWIEERKKLKDHKKVVARTQWEYGSFSKPDRESIRFRVQQRNSHGWRAPLNKRYAQLGSSVTEPLSRTPGVHLSLARKPEGGDAKVDRNLTGSRIVSLTLGEPYSDSVAKFGIARFAVQHDDPKAHLVVFVDSQNGDPDIFVSR